MGRLTGIGGTAGVDFSGGGGAPAPQSRLTGKVIFVDAATGDDADAVTAANKDFMVPFQTITAALAASSAGDTVYVSRGTYPESVIVKAGVALVGDFLDGLVGPTLTGSSPTTTTVVLLHGSTLSNFVVHCPSTSGHAIAVSGATINSVRNCTLVGNDGTGNGIDASSSGMLGLTEVYHIGGTLNDVLHATDGAVLIQGLIGLEGECVDVVHNAGTGTVDGWHLGSNEGYTSTRAIHLSAAGSARLLNSTMRGQEYGVVVDVNGATVNIVNFDFENTVHNDVLIDPSVTSVDLFRLKNCSLKMNSVLVPDAVAVQAVYSVNGSDITPGFVGQRATAGMSAGTHQKGAASEFGEGPEHVTGMVVQTNTNILAGAWVVQTAKAASSGGSPFNFLPGTTAGSAIYIGGDKQLPAIWLNTSTIKNWGPGDVVWEYFNNTSWVPMHIMSVLESGTSTAQDVLSTVGVSRIRFGDRPGDVKTTLNSENKFWVRCRATAGVTATGALEQIRLGTNQFRTNENGRTEHVGASQRRSPIMTWDPLTVTEVSGEQLANENIDLGGGFILLAKNNKFRNNSVDSVAYRVRVVPGMDTSRSARVTVRWKPTGTDTGLMDLTWTQLLVRDGVVLDGSTVPTVVAQSPSITPGGIDAETQSFTHDLYFPDALPGDIAFVKLTRDGSGDAFSDHMVLIDTSGDYSLWT